MLRVGSPAMAEQNRASTLRCGPNDNSGFFSKPCFSLSRSVLRAFNFSPEAKNYRLITASAAHDRLTNSAAVAMRAPSIRSSSLIWRALAHGVHTRIGTSWAWR